MSDIAQRGVEEAGLRPVVAVVQARMSSTRLPGKVLMEACGRPLLWHLIERLRRARTLDRIVIATSTDPSDDVIERLCKEWSTDCFRGSLDDVLDRYYRAAKLYGAGTVVRITADCPLIDPAVVDMVVGRFLMGGFDRGGTESSFPNGLDTEVLRFTALERAWREARLASEREHVSTYIRFNPDRFRLSSIAHEPNYEHMRWTVDEPADYELVRRIFEGLYVEGGPIFGKDDILAFLKRNPEIVELNSHIRRNEGYAKSLREDRVLPPREVNGG